MPDSVPAKPCQTMRNEESEELINEYSLLHPDAQPLKPGFFLVEPLSYFQPESFATTMVKRDMYVKLNRTALVCSPPFFLFFFFFFGTNNPPAYPWALFGRMLRETLARTTHASGCGFRGREDRDRNFSRGEACSGAASRYTCPPIQKDSLGS